MNPGVSQTDGQNGGDYQQSKAEQDCVTNWYFRPKVPIEKRKQPGISSDSAGIGGIFLCECAERPSVEICVSPSNSAISIRVETLAVKSGRWGSNPRRPAWEAGILPLNYARNIACYLTSTYVNRWRLSDTLSDSHLRPSIMLLHPTTPRQVQPSAEVGGIYRIRRWLHDPRIS